ncbi:MAG: carbohydrate ABC transporter permease [Eubacteriales bacterium]|nr:carbohydrate ABC transporter permease [Eubacteriales bacterium]
MKRSVRKNIVNCAINIMLLIIAFMYLLPFFWIISTSLRPVGESYRMPPSFFPTQFNIEAYKQLLLNEFPFFMTFLNSAKVTLCVVFGQIIICTMAAYAFACIRFPGKGILFGILLTGLMMPIQVTAIPSFVLMTKLNLINSLWSVILPYCSSIFGIFLLRQFFMSIPIALAEAAKIDGAGYFRIFAQVMLPQVKPAIATMVIYGMNQSWNNYFSPLLYLNQWDKMTLPIGMVVMRDNLPNGLGCVMAGIVLAIIPIFILFVFCQQYFVEGVAAQGVKG